LKGKAAELRKASEYAAPAGRGARGFNAFKSVLSLIPFTIAHQGAREMAAKKEKETPKAKPEVYLQFMGTKLRVHEGEDGEGMVKSEDVVFVRGATMRFEGWEGEVVYRAVKVGWVDLFFFFDFFVNVGDTGAPQGPFLPSAVYQA
jgi:lupus La protein